MSDHVVTNLTRAVCSSTVVERAKKSSAVWSSQKLLHCRRYNPVFFAVLQTCKFFQERPRSCSERLCCDRRTDDVSGSCERVKMSCAHPAFVSWPSYAFSAQRFSASKSEFVSSRCVRAHLRYRSRNRHRTYHHGSSGRLPTAERVVQSSMAETDNLPEYNEEDANADIELTPEELALCGDFRADLPLLNKVILTGRMGADPVLKNIGDDANVVNFSIAVTTEYDPDEGRDQERTSWFDIEAWGSTAEYISKYGKKGMRVGVSGPININSWTGRDGEVRESPIVTADTFEILQSRSEQMPSVMDNNSSYANEGRNTTQYRARDSGMGTTQDLKDLPF